MRFCHLPSSSLLLGLLLSGCASVGGYDFEPEAHISVGNNREYGAYLLAQERLSRIRPGIDRGTFLRKMQLRRLPSEDWYTTFSGGDGWLVGLSRKNQANEGNLFEEYSFGYHEGHRVVERNLVILKNGKVSSVLEHQLPQEPTAEGGLGALTAAKLPRALFTDDLTREEENYLLRNYIKKYHLTRQAFAQAEPRLKKVRAGMTAGELRYHLQGYFYRLRHGYVYFADGFLWGPRFQTIQTSTGSLTIMSFGYVEGEKEVERARIRIVNGLISEIKWLQMKPASESGKDSPKTPSS